MGSVHGWTNLKGSGHHSTRVVRQTASSGDWTQFLHLTGCFRRLCTVLERSLNLV